MTTTATGIDLVPMDTLADAASCLRVLAHPTRLRIVDVLAQGDFAVGEVAELCGGRGSSVCEHMRLMQACGLLASERRGREVHYRIAAPQLPEILECVRRHCGKPSKNTGERK